MPGRRRPLIVLAVLAVLAASCGGGGDDDFALVLGGLAGEAARAVPPPEPEVLAPLTGVGVPESKADGLARAALVVKVDNGEPKARPQAGIRGADVVFEEEAEGSTTRLASVFHSVVPDRVGPVRSARTTDLFVVTLLNRPLFSWSGANGIVAPKIRAGALVDVGWDAFPPAYERDRNRSAPSNLFVDGEMLHERAPDDAAPPVALFQYRPAGDASPGSAAGGVHVDFGGGAGSAPVDWRWSADTERWLRDQKGTPHVDEDGEQLDAHNVVIQFTRYVDSGQTDVTGAAVPEGQIVGEGEVWVFTDAKRVVGRWSRPSQGDITTFVDGDGAPIRLTPGRTWVMLPRAGRAELRG